MPLLQRSGYPLGRIAVAALCDILGIGGVGYYGALGLAGSDDRALGLQPIEAREDDANPQAEVASEESSDDDPSSDGTRGGDGTAGGDNTEAERERIGDDGTRGGDGTGGGDNTGDGDGTGGNDGTSGGANTAGPRRERRRRWRRRQGDRLRQPGVTYAIRGPWRERDLRPTGGRRVG